MTKPAASKVRSADQDAFSVLLDELAKLAVAEHLTTERERAQALAAERTNPVPLPQVDKAA